MRLKNLNAQLSHDGKCVIVSQDLAMDPVFLDRDQLQALIDLIDAQDKE